MGVGVEKGMTEKGVGETEIREEDDAAVNCIISCIICLLTLELLLLFALKSSILPCKVSNPVCLIRCTEYGCLMIISAFLNIILSVFLQYTCQLHFALRF
jgi:hypothetical protein